MRKLFVLFSLLAVMLLASVPVLAQQSNTIVDVARAIGGMGSNNIGVRQIAEAVGSG